jgi:N-acyl homoserine lactone hydrolase
MPVRVRPLECGWLTSDMGTMLSGRIGDFRMPVGAFLVEHERGRLVFDTGMHPDLVDDAGRLGPIESMFQVDLDASGLLGARLAEHGVDPGEVDMAVLSHLHYDHCGGLVEVPESRLVVQRDEWSAAQDPVLAELGVYHPADFDTGQEVELVEGRHDLFGDGSVVAVPTPGHTAGHQSLLIEGRLLLVGDACYCQLALDDDVLPPIAADAERQRAGFSWLREQAAGGVQLVYSHDPVQWPTLGELL